MRVALQERVRNDVANANTLGGPPIDDGQGSHDQHGNEQHQSRAHADPVDNLARDEAHERDRHWKAIPEKACVVGGEVIVRASPGDVSASPKKKTP